MMDFSAEYWNRQYREKLTGWDMGYASPPLVDYVNQLQNKNLKILVPGAGNAWEVEFLWKNGFHHTYLLDFSIEAIKLFKSRVPDFPEENILVEDFFKHQGKYDLILEQTFFSSLLPEKRPKYISRMQELLSEKGKLVGLYFNHEFQYNSPPFGASQQVYQNLFEDHFVLHTFELAHNSIKPRKGREIFIIAIRKII